MLVELDGRVYTVPEEYANKLISQLWELAMAEYEKVPKAYRIGGMAIARKMLYDMETSITKTHGKEVALQIARPAKGADPNKHLLWIMTRVLREAVKSATFIIGTEEATNTASSFAISIARQGEAGGSLATDGNIGERENNGGKVARHTARETLPNE
jgi:hypothetical protein